MKILNQIIKIAKYPFLKRKYGRSVKFDYSVEIGINSKFEGMNFIDKNSYFAGEMGFGSYLARESCLVAKIGRYTSIGSFVKCNNGVHPYTKFVSTSPVFYSESKQKLGGSFTNIQFFEERRYADIEKKFHVIIGNDSWIGDGVFFAGGVTVGDGAVVLAHAVVTKDVQPYTIVGGIPAKIIQHRFEEKTIQFLLEFKWWNKDEFWLRENLHLMHDIDEFKNKMNI